MIVRGFHFPEDVNIIMSRRSRKWSLGGRRLEQAVMPNSCDAVENQDSGHMDDYASESLF